MPFLRLSRDQRGYENTFLLHAVHPGGRPRVLYWYRSAPGVRVGRLALDEDAIRAIEERYPEIEFDWPLILEEANSLPPEAELRPERPRRKAPRPREFEASTSPAVIAPPQPEREPVIEIALAPAPPEALPAPLPIARPRVPHNALLDELVGREIAFRLRGRFAEIQARLDLRSGRNDHVLRPAWQARADRLNPDSWTSPEAVLQGVQHADRQFDDLRIEISATD